ncbi:peptidase S41 [Lentzea sp. NEAU-D13]|uniref:Peptidase S41 n=1 Tax=Lentzea alba TaxID=2714351 RepID=A0A7C9VRI6_9PSEU|nr:S41 family peptidase [Lentzea alba]NGY58976.1 peptidase S41 [Lentzea alba]
MIRRALLVLLLTATTAGEPVPEARAYLDTALDLLQQHSFESLEADWPRLRAQAHRDAAHARRPADTYPAIERAITTLGNPHTNLLASPDGGAPSSGERNVPGGRMIGSVAYLTLPPTASEDGDVYVDSGRRLMHDLVAAHPGGWVVDLRGNFGGDMAPMLTVVAPLLGEGKKGAFVGRDGTRTDWGVRDGHVFNGELVRFPQVEMPAANGAVALLVDGRTASSGEAVLISFIGAQNARSFGGPTAGYASSNELFELPDGAQLAITTALMADRTGRTYGNAPITPHTLVGDGDALTAAIEWLSEQT